MPWFNGYFSLEQLSASILMVINADLAIMNGNAILQIIMSLRGDKNRILKMSISLTRLFLNNINY